MSEPNINSFFTIEVRGKPSWSNSLLSMVGMLVPLKGGIGSIVHPPIGSIYHLYTTYIYIYILPSGGLYATNPTFYGNQKARTISGIFPANWGMDYATYIPPF